MGTAARRWQRVCDWFLLREIRTAIPPGDGAMSSATSPPGERELEYAKEFWTLSNVIAGLAVLQGVVFMSAVWPGRRDLAPVVLETRVERAGTAIVTLLFTIGYSCRTHVLRTG
jgi:hypothetical protein